MQTFKYHDYGESRMSRYTNCIKHFGDKCYKCKKKIEENDAFILPYSAIIMHSRCWGSQQ